ncbi:MAG: glycosyltransferase family 2 protein [Nitrosotalea sp.]
MKLVILIPAYNEEATIEKVIKSIPQKIFGIDKIEILVVNDGSVDRTSDLAFNCGADKVVSHKVNMGVGAAFMTGIRNAISMDADVVVTLDADAQFTADQIPELIFPILNRQSDVVIGSRFLKNIPLNMPKIKLIGNGVFTKMISFLVNQKFTDTQTGFRAYSKDAILNISVVNEFTYTQEVLIDLKFKGFKISEIPVAVSYDDKRKSRVVKSIFNYTRKSISVIIRSLIYHRPVLAFGIFGGMVCAGGILAKLLTISHILIISRGLSTGLIILGIVSFMMGLFASVVFKRQAFTEKDMRHHIKDSNRSNN